MNTAESKRVNIDTMHAAYAIAISTIIPFFLNLNVLTRNCHCAGMSSICAGMSPISVLGILSLRFLMR